MTNILNFKIIKISKIYATLKFMIENEAKSARIERDILQRYINAGLF